MNTTTTCAPFVELVAQRTELGRRLHGASHLNGASLLDPLVVEAADAFNWLRLERKCWVAQEPELLATRAVQLLTLIRAAREFGNTCVRARDRAQGQLRSPWCLHWAFELEAHDRDRAARAELGPDNYLSKDCLAEAREEIADAVILARWETERRVHHGALDECTRLALDRVDRHGIAFGQLTTALHQQTPSRRSMPATQWR